MDRVEFILVNFFLCFLIVYYLDVTQFVALRRNVDRKEIELQLALKVV